MSNGFFTFGLSEIINSNIDLLSDTIKAVLIDAADYTVDLANDQDFADVDVAARVSSTTLASKSLSGSIFDAADAVFSAVSGDSCEAVLIYKDSGVESSSTLIAYIDTAIGLPITLVGDDVTLQFDNGIAKIFDYDDETFGSLKVLKPIHHTTAITAAGYQFTKMTANGVEIDFADHHMGAVGTIDDHYAARNRNEWSMLNMFDDGSVIGPLDIDLKLQLTEGLVEFAQKLLNFDINWTADVVNGSMKAVPSIEMDSFVSALWSFDYCSIEFRVQLPGNGDTSKALLMVPSVSQKIVRFDDIDEIPTAEEFKFVHPGPGDRGGQGVLDAVDGIVAYDEPVGAISPSAGGIANSQAIYLWDSETNEGVLFRTFDNVGQNKIFSVQRAGDNLIVRVRFIPQDNSIGVNNQSDEIPFGYGLEIRPMTGDFNDALRYDAERKKAESFSAFDKPRINDPASTFPAKMKSATCFSWLNSGGSGFDFSKFVEQNQRIKKFFAGGSHSVLSSWYGSGPGDLNEFAPTHTPFNNNFVEQVAAAIALQQTVIVYTLPFQADVIETDAAALGILADTVKTRTGYVYSEEPDLDASEEPITTQHLSVSGRLKYAAFTFADSANNAELVSFIVDQFASIGIHGFYLDVAGFYGASCNDDPNADSADRGFGNKTFTPGILSISDLFRSESDVVDAIVMHEWPSDFSVKVADFFAWNSFGPVIDSPSQVFGPSAQFGDRIRHSTFNSFGQGANENLDSFTIDGVVDKKEILNSYFAYWFAGGHLMPVSAYWALRDEYFIALEGEADFDDWFEAAIPHYEFIARLWWKQEALVRRFHTSKRLFEMNGSSVVRRKVDEALSLTSTQSTYVHSQGWYDEFNDVLGFCCSNFTLTLAEGGFLNVTETWDDFIDVNNFPELGLAARTVQLLDCGTGEIETLADYDGSGGYTFNVEMTPGRVVWLIMGDYVHEPAIPISLVAEDQTTVNLLGN